jgi:hypothetical protein
MIISKITGKRDNSKIINRFLYMVSGILLIVDGLITLISFGFYSGDLNYTFLVYCLRRYCEGRVLHEENDY